MVDPTKVYLMTQAARYEEKEKNGAISIVSFRRKDYILYHLIGVFISVTVAYAILAAAALFMVIMAYDTIVLNVGEMVLIAIGIFLGYLVVLIIYYIISHKYYGDKHVKARQSVQRYLRVLRELEEYENQVKGQED